MHMYIYICIYLSIESINQSINAQAQSDGFSECNAKLPEIQEDILGAAHGASDVWNKWI